VKTVIDDIVALLTGQLVDLAGRAPDMDGLGDLDRQVYEVAAIPAARCRTATSPSTGGPDPGPAVGLGRNPWPSSCPAIAVGGTGS
jgi:hypothetical protein